MAGILTGMNSRYRGRYRLDRFDHNYHYYGAEFVKHMELVRSRRSRYLKEGKKVWIFYIHSDGRMTRLRDNQLSSHYEVIKRKTGH